MSFRALGGGSLVKRLAFDLAGSCASMIAVSVTLRQDDGLPAMLRVCDAGWLPTTSVMVMDRSG